MQNSLSKSVSRALNEVNQSFRRCRNLNQIVVSYSKLDNGHEGLENALRDLASATEDLYRRAQEYHRLIADAASSLNGKT